MNYVHSVVIAEEKSTLFVNYRELFEQGISVAPDVEMSTTLCGELQSGLDRSFGLESHVLGGIDPVHGVLIPESEPQSISAVKADQFNGPSTNHHRAIKR